MKATTQETDATGVSATSRIGGLKDRKTGQSKMPNRTIWFPQRQQQPQDSSVGSGCPRMGLLLMYQVVARGK
jgi:hypothetical protein